MLLNAPMKIHTFPTIFIVALSIILIVTALFVLQNDALSRDYVLLNHNQYAIGGSNSGIRVQVPLSSSILLKGPVSSLKDVDI